MSIAAYQTNQDLNVLSASPLELVRMLYAGAIKAAQSAQDALERGDIRTRSAQIIKACNIIEELALSLDREKGGDIAANLAELYVYIHRRLLDANVQQSAAPLIEAKKLLNSLLSAWQQVPEAASTQPTVPDYTGSLHAMATAVNAASAPTYDDYSVHQPLRISA